MKFRFLSVFLPSVSIGEYNLWRKSVVQVTILDIFVLACASGLTWKCSYHKERSRIGFFEPSVHFQLQLQQDYTEVQVVRYSYQGIYPLQRMIDLRLTPVS